MSLSRDEARALGFIALVLALSAAVRTLDRPRPVSLDAERVDIGALEEASRARAGATAAPPLGPNDRLDPNTASVDELLRLPRMRRSVAEAIVQARAKAPLRTLTDLDRVPGVGPVTLEAWRPHLSLREERRPAAGTPSSDGEPIRLNTATETELESLPGIGPALAARIVAWRDSAGGFRDLDELAKVRGIGPATLARLKPMLRLH